MASAQLLSKSQGLVSALKEANAVRVALPRASARAARVDARSIKRNPGASVRASAPRRGLSVQAASGNGAVAPVAGLPIDLRGIGAGRYGTQ